MELLLWAPEISPVVWVVFSCESPILQAVTV